MRPVLLALGLLLLSPSARAEAPVIAALQSDQLELYRQALTGFGGEAPGLEVVSFSLDGDAKNVDAVLARVKARKPALVLALGPLAANAARRALGEVPIVFCMVPNHEKYGLEAKNVTGIALTRPLDDQLAAIHAVAPGAVRVGVLYTPAYSQGLIDQATVSAKALGLTLVPEKLGKGPLAALAAALAAKVDALWLIADRGTATVAATSTLIKAARTAKIPLFALTEGQVREGALMAFSASPLTIGAQAGKLSKRIVLEKVDPGALAILPPEGMDAWINLGTARAIGLDAGWSSRVLQYAAEKSLAVRVYP